MSKQFVQNTFWVTAAFATNFLIGFFISPYLVSKLGVVSYGFISLGNNLFVATGLLSVALNAMAGRFLAVSVHKNDLPDANIQFNTVLFSNLILALPLGAILFGALIFRNSIFNIPPELSRDVGFLFGAQILVFLLSMCFSAFGGVFFVTNRVDLQNMLVFFSKLLYAVLILTLFCIFAPSLSLIGVAITLPLLMVLTMQIVAMRKFLPSIKVSYHYFKLDKLATILSAGCWSLITQLSRICLYSLDVILANIFLGPLAAGILTVAKIIPLQLEAFNGALNTIFAPTITRMYAENKLEELCIQTKRYMNFAAFLLQVPILLFITYGDAFFRLWMPGVDSQSVYMLSCITLIPLLLSVPGSSLFFIFRAFNKIKIPALSQLLISLITLICELLLLKYTKVGLLAIVLPIALLSPLYSAAFILIYSARLVQMPWYYYVKSFLIIMVKTGSVLALLQIFKYLYTPSSWLSMILTCATTGLLGLSIAFYLFFTAADRKTVLKTIKSITGKVFAFSFSTPKV